MSELISSPYKPKEAYCCERCAFGGGNHAVWCPERKAIESDVHHSHVKVTTAQTKTDR
jgi:hypothetical protein